ncbi:vitronectin a [Megalops cyprinoides]|uniref:vitronectin a n=1 Tax=Megalops cyprinoides TaxID=118141 RepID=UPI001864EEF5|nr:vitronectin a [Megalops cyprinoides]
MKLWAVLLLATLATAFAAEDSCVGRCENGFDSKMKCQCDSMCRYYESCCSDYDSTCRIKTRGDTFAFAEDDDEQFNSTTTEATPSPPRGGRKHSTPSQPLETQMLTPSPPLTNPPPDPASSDPVPTDPVSTDPAPTDPTSTDPAPTDPTPTDPAPTDPAPTDPAPTDPTSTDNTPTRAPDPEADTCSGLPFDSFMQVKNGSMYAFRGEYFFELDEKSVLPGYPKLIKDVWGISGPIDAAFTRINCQGKTYIFKGNKYWRFEDGVLDDDYPRDISVGFEKIPDNVDAAFAIPATNHHGKEKVYFFKGDQYYLYEFHHQPSHEECSRMSTSTLFTRYTDLYYDAWEEYFHHLFRGIQGHHAPHFINRDWLGIRSPVDAVMAGRLYVTPRPQPPPFSRWPGPRPDEWGRDQWGGQRQWGGRGQGWPWGQNRRQSRSPQWDPMAEWGIGLGQDYAERFYRAERRRQDQDQQRDGYRRQQQQQQQQNDYDYNYDYRYSQQRTNYMSKRSQPVQSVYFFKKDKYYRVDLQTKRVDYANPPYPRSIAKYWLGCPEKPGAEKR